MPRRAALVLVSLLLAPACGDGPAPGDRDSGGVDASPAPDAEPPLDADTGPIPRVEPAACRFVVPAGLGLTEGTGYECGNLVVYEDRDAATGATVKVHYIRVFSSADSTNATIYLDGGPGGNGNGILSYLNYLGDKYVDDLMVDGDFLVIAQRGTSLSEPSLACNTSDCSDVLNRAHLPSYNTAYNADDVDDLRSTLGYDQLNLYGISYGSRLGLEVMRRHGDHLRCSTIGGLVPAQIVWAAGFPKTFLSALTALNSACVVAGQCGTAYGDLVAKLITGVESLDQEPLTFDSGNGEPVTLDGASYAGLLFSVMYSSWTYPMLPLVISDVAERRTDRISATIEYWFDVFENSESSISWGLYYSVVCGELFNPPDYAAYDDANAVVPATLRDVFAGYWQSYLDVCGSWPVGDPRPELSQPVSSAVRTLVASGAMDPITPPSYGDLAASTLSDRQVVVFPASGHGATLQSYCGNRVFLNFLAHPDQSVVTACTASLAVDFELPGKVVPWSAADRARMAFELGQAPIPPPILERLASLRHPR